MSQEAIFMIKEAVRTKDRASLERHVGHVSTTDFEPITMTEIAVICKEGGHQDLAEQLLLRAIERDPALAAAHYEIAVVYRLSNRKHAAIASLLQARIHAPGDFRIELLLTHMLHAIGAHPEAEEVSNSMQPGSEAETAQLAVLHDFAKYLKEFPQGRGQHILNSVRRKFDYLDVGNVAARIRTAILEARGFSLVRLGDGEGAFAKISLEDEARYPALYSSIRREWCTLLFGAGFDPVATGYAAVVETLMQTSCEADVVGVPYPDWLDHEYAISSFRGVPCLLNVHRNLLAFGDADGPAMCDQRIHIELHQQGLIEPILRMTPEIGLISCLPDLPGRLQDRFGLNQVELFKIPGERYSETLLSADALAGVHFPYVFWDIARRLSVPHNGRVFLIAAGTLAKFYAAIIKRHGGIALDIGSLVDGWMRIASRPGYDDTLGI